MTQKEALDILKMGHNVFLTGEAGSGKTYLLNEYIRYLQAHKIPVGITASTGIAATHMGGTTIHSFTGMGIRDSLNQSDLTELLKRSYLRNRFTNTRVLIIDEISMLHASRLDMVDLLCRVFKHNSLPFGGMQVILCGDFFQLPPVTKNPKSEFLNPKQIQNTNEQNQKSFEFLDLKNLDIVSNLGFGASDLNNDYVYHSDSWKSMNIKVCYLEEQYRQDDRALQRVLNDIRTGEVNEMTVEYLTERINKDVEDGYVRPTRLFTHNIDADAINQTHLEKLTGESQEFFMSWSGSFGIIETLKKSCLAPEKLVLKIGAQVMFVKNNYEAGYVNGTLGEVIDFTKENAPLVRTFDGQEIVVAPANWEVKEESVIKASISQLPLRLAWAITVHKSQGMSLDAAEVDLSKSFVPGMGYVALSRVRSLKGLKLLGINQRALEIDQTVLKKDKEFLQSSNEEVMTLQKMEKEKKEQLQRDFIAFLMEK